MSSKYKYSLIKYKHSQFLDESLNIGVLAYFENTEEFFLRYSSKLNRAKSIYNKVPEKLIRHYFKNLEKHISKLNNANDPFIKNEINEYFDQFLSEHLLPRDSSALQFSKGVSNFQNDKSNKEIKEYLIESFLFPEHSTQENKDKILLNSFYSKVKKEIEHINENYFIRDFKIENKTGIEFKFNYAWKNGSWNLIKPLNFDLKEANSILRKTHENYGLVVDLKEKSEKENLKFDFLVGEPTKRELFKEYDHSLNLLSELDRLRIIEQKDIKSYTEKAIETLLNY